MRPTEALKWLGEQLHSIDMGVKNNTYRSCYTCKEGVYMEFRRVVKETEKIETILQPPMLLDRITDLFHEAGFTNQMSFNVKHYPTPVPDGKSKPRTYGNYTTIQHPIHKDGGWDWGKEGDRHRVLYKVKVIIYLEPVMCSDELLKVINTALWEDTWDKNPRHVEGKCDSRFFTVGEEVIRSKYYSKPNEKLYFVTTYAIPGGGGVRVLKVLPNGKQSFISLQTALKAGA